MQFLLSNLPSSEDDYDDGILSSGLIYFIYLLYLVGLLLKAQLESSEKNNVAGNINDKS